MIQWQEEVAKFGIAAIAPSLEPSSDIALTNLFRRLATGGTHVLIVTNDLLCLPAFQSTVATKTKNSDHRIATMFVGDEAHTLGAHGFISNKPDFFERRLALSATPERQYDPDGTEEIFKFFGPLVYEFGLDRAIGFCLTPYNYYVHAATLDGDELDEFDALTGRIGAVIGRGLAEDDSTLTSLLIARRRIIETPQAKISLLRAVLDRRGPRTLTQTLIYASAKNPQQFNDIAAMLTELDIRWGTCHAGRNLKHATTQQYSGHIRGRRLPGPACQEGTRRRNRHPQHQRGIYCGVVHRSARMDPAARPGSPAPPRETMGDRA